jgi:phosphopantothenoylcysteine decarboxylase/phosphopantothenate--cysteine ligase
MATSANVQTTLPSLSGKRLVLGVCGGIAAYKSLELLRLLRQNGCAVQVVMSPNATRFIAPLSFEALSGQPVHVSAWPQEANLAWPNTAPTTPATTVTTAASHSQSMPHIALERNCDGIVVAPCSAHSAAKYAHGLADTLLDNLVLARRCPLAVAPAMNVHMWNNPATQRNIAQLRADSVHVFGPAVGIQACGEEGPGRLQEAENLLWEIARWQETPLLKGKTVLLTAGPTIEAIDPVRGITNRSSGKMGYAMAKAAWLLGAARVILVSGPTGLPVPHGIESLAVESAQDMLHAVQANLEEADIFIGAAAVADYTVANRQAHKHKKPEGADLLGQNGQVSQINQINQIGPSIQWALNPDILAMVGQTAALRLTDNQNNIKNTKKPLYVIGFAAETENLDAAAQSKLIRKQAHCMVGNLAQHTLGQDHASVTLYRPNLPIQTIPSQAKLHLAIGILRSLFM